MKYIDKTISEVYNCSFQILKKILLMIFIYFSDHGRSQHQQEVTILAALHMKCYMPLIIFFNDSAFNIYKEKFDKLKN